ncbi:MAG: hypothetical protein ACREX4_15750 [Gammaproteobacteria bacterium]
MICRMCTGFALALSLAAWPLYGQEATEIYIPIGASPGVSETATIIGKVGTVDQQNRTLSISDSAGTYAVTITDETDIWLDRSKIQKANQTGSLSDLKTGLSAEVKYKEPARSPSLTADWIKVEILE